jgi:subfamily B ATP-binding cassette protein MsbA
VHGNNFPVIVFLLKLWEFARPYKFRLVLGVLAGILAGLTGPLVIAVITLVSSIIFQPAGGDSSIPTGFPAVVRPWLANAQAGMGSGLREHPWAVVLLVMTIPMVMLLSRLLGYLNTYWLQWVAIRAVTDLRIKLFSHLLELSAAFFNRSSSGELISRVAYDTTALQMIISGATSVVVRDPFILIGIVAFLFIRQPMITLIALGMLPLCLIPLTLFHRRVRRVSQDAQTQAADLAHVMTEVFSGYRVIKAYSLEKLAVGDFVRNARDGIGYYMQLVQSTEASGPFVDFMASLGVALAVLYMVYVAGTHPNAGDFVQLAASIFYMYGPLKNLIRLHTQLTIARTATLRVFELLATTNSVPEPAQPKPLPSGKVDISLENVDFSYGEKTVLHKINLTIQAGQLVALVGASGSGKTTLANLLLRFYDPICGAIRIGGVDIRDVSPRDLRNRIAVVTQENILFNDTIRRNIELGRPGATGEEIVKAAQQAHAEEFILQKPKGYDTVIGERGVVLSGGQRQRLAIARALLKNAPILVLDEATSALDTESERVVQVALDELMQGRTTVCIAHRLSTILHADVIVVLNQGRIVETGRHVELVKQGGVYQKLYDMQFAS